MNAQIYTYVSRLRKYLGPAVQIVRRRPGYMLDIGASEFDADRFERLARSGREALRCGRYEEAATTLRAALACWRGQYALTNVTEFLAHVEPHRLEEARMVALESRIEADLHLGRHVPLVAELTGLLAAHPLRERVRAQLMTALYRCDRQSDALAVYHEGRRLLCEEVGSDPGPTLTAVYHGILAMAPALDAPRLPDPPHPNGSVRIAAARPAATGPAMLPPDLVGFAGRECELDLLRDLLRPTGHTDRLAAFPVITGRTGVGKTALAIHAAHARCRDFPDGQLFADLGGTSRRPADPADVLGWFLRALDVDESAIPESLHARAQLYRNTVSGRRVLVLLDNAAHAGQVTPLLPSGPTCRAIVTSRRRLVLNHAVPIVLDDPLGADQVLTLFASGAERFAVSRRETRSVVELCG